MQAQLYIGYNTAMPKVRVDILLVERGLAESRNQAQRLVMAGQVRANGQVVSKPSTTMPAEAVLTIDQGPAFVSRGGEKLQAALQAFAVDTAGKVCADVGASTGGFTDCLLQNGAAKVYAIDVGQGILHWKLRTDPRVVVMEDTNARYLEGLPEPIDLVTVDASFISLKILLPVIKGWFRSAATPGGSGGGDAIALVKPQFEAGRSQTARGDGVIRDPVVHRQVLQDVSSFALAQGYRVRGVLRSPLLGPKGNAEFLVWMDYPARLADDLEAMLDKLFS
jgi:23S rRNA (cytidine1920-2'-O)/16S rRNA (cytidine1409-2'-O)-methyltransferase